MDLDLNTDDAYLLLIIAATLFAHLLESMFMRHIQKATSFTHNIWDDSLIEAARSPLPFFIWLTGTFFALRFIHFQSDDKLLEFLNEAQIVSVVACVAWFLLRLINSVSNNIIKDQTLKEKEVDRTTINGLSKLFRVIILIISFLVILQSLGFSVSGILAFGGVGGIAVGFAARDMLANFFGGLMIHLDRPFNIGDRIRSPDRQIEGFVEHIGWRQTSLRAMNMSVMYVPNSLFASIVVENSSRITQRKIEETIGLRYSDLNKVTPIVTDIRTMLSIHPEIDDKQLTLVGFNQFGESSIDIMLLAFTKTTELEVFQKVKQDVLLKIAEIVARHDADFAFPTRTLITQTA